MLKMRQQLVPALLLAAALSHVLSAPLNSVQPLGYQGQTNDNTFRNIYSTILCKEVFEISHVDDSLKPCSYYRQRGYQFGDNRRTYESTLEKDYKNNGEGFRKEQWHNYPRQLDRLQHSPYDRNKPHYKKRIFEPDDYKGSVDSPPDRLSQFLTTNEYVLTNDAPQNVYESLIASTGPLLVLKIRLACLNNGRVNRTLADAARDILARLDANDLKKDFDDEELTEQQNIEIVPSKREASSNEQEIDIWEDTASGGSPERLPIQKRLFSLWSRLQSLSHKGHELHHRRHMHFLGLPDEMGGETALTAETRAALMRPPGSPLRWG